MFNEEVIAHLFGNEAAEDEDIDRLRAYYLKSSTYDQIKNNLPLRILVGHKGIGKSAMFRVAMYEEEQEGKLSILIKPDDILNISLKKPSETSFLELIRDWKEGILEIIAFKVLSSFGLVTEGWRSKLNDYGGRVLDFLASTFKESSNKINTDPAKKKIIDSFLKHNNIYVYIDDLDRGWQGLKDDIIKVSALLNATRDISSEMRGVHFRISLRADVYYLVRTSDESTDKIESSVIWLSWNNHEILALLVKRILQYEGKSEINTEKLISMRQEKLAKYLDKYIEPRFLGKGHWKNIPTYRMMMSLIRKRPRDLVKLCILAARKASEKHKNKIGTPDFEMIFEEYSQGRLQDTINEYRFELNDIERLLLGMRPTTKEKKAKESYLFSTDKLLKKIENIMQSGVFRFANNEIADKKELAAFMYKINFITARKDTETGIDRKYFEENRYLSNKFVDFGYDWEIHPAYRWALQPDDFNSIYNIKLI